MSAQRSIARARLKLRETVRAGRSRLTPVSRSSRYRNVFHCCVHKTGSQWIRHLLADPVIYRYSGLRTHHYQSHLPGGVDPRAIVDRTFAEPFPADTIVSPLYINYENFSSIAGRQDGAGFFVMRDPRDIVVSWYFSSRFSHRLMGDLAEIRDDLSALPEREGLSYSMRYLEKFGLFDALRSWGEAASRDATVEVVRFEDLIGDLQEKTLSNLLEHCDIRVPSQELRALLADHDFKHLSGRERGQEDPQAFYRKGVAGDWREHFDASLIEEFNELTHDLAAELGYA